MFNLSIQTSARISLELLFIMLSLFSAAYAANFAKCCTRVPLSSELQPFQWTACNAAYNNSETDPAKKYSMPVRTTLAWCRQNCVEGGVFQGSNTEQWLSPFVAWVLPAITILLLCPISEHLRNPRDIALRTTFQKWLHRLVLNWFEPLVEYIQILGDPTSAFNGALTHMITDWTLCVALKRPRNTERERVLIATVILAEQVDFELDVVRNAFEILSGLEKAREYSKTACRVMFSARKKFNISVALPVALYIGVAATVFYDAMLKLGDRDTAHSLAYGIWYNWMILLSVFSNCFATHVSLESVRSGLEVIIRGCIENHTYEETKRLGWDRSMVHGAPTPRYELAAFSLLPYPPPVPTPHMVVASGPPAFTGFIEVKAVPLHERYFNSQKWGRWLYEKGVDNGRPKKGIGRYQTFWVNWGSKTHPNIRYMICQLLSWTFVLYPCFCAAFISYTTPKVGIGCRSFNFIAYAGLSLAVAILRVCKDCLYLPHGADPASTVTGVNCGNGSGSSVIIVSEKSSSSRMTRRRRVLYHIISITYHTFATINAVVVMIGGTTMQLAGGYRNCFCYAGFQDMSGTSTINLSTNTQEQQLWAKSVWLMVGLWSYGGIVFACLCALAIRLYISHRIENDIVA